MPCLPFSVQTLPHRLQCPCGAGAGDVTAVTIAYPLSESKRSVLSFLYSIVKVRFGFLFFEQFSIRFKAKNRFGLQLNHPTKGTKEIVDNLARISPPL